MKSIVPFASMLTLLATVLVPAAPAVTRQSSNLQTAAVNPNDAKGCADSSDVSRLPNTTLSSCQAKPGDVQVTSGKDTNGQPVTKMINGQAQAWTYKTPNGMPITQVFSGLESVVKEAGFAIVYESAPNTLTATKDNTWCVIQTSPGSYTQTIIVSTALAPTAAAESPLAQRLDQMGRVALIGVTFDNQGALASESDPVLTQVATMMTANPNLKIRVDAYAYNGTDAADNLSISQREADAVVNWLSVHGVQRNRIGEQAMGAATPLPQAEATPTETKSHPIDIVKVQ